MLLRWGQKDLAERAAVSLPSIKALEAQPGPLKTDVATVEAIARAFEKGGVMFLAEGDACGRGGPGVRLVAEVAEPIVLASSPCLGDFGEL